MAFKYYSMYSTVVRSKLLSLSVHTILVLFLIPFFIPFLFFSLSPPLIAAVKVGQEVKERKQVSLGKKVCVRLVWGGGGGQKEVCVVLVVQYGQTRLMENLS